MKHSAVISSKVVTKKKDEGQKYLDYFEYSEDLRKCPGHRLLAIFRGEREGILRVNAGVDTELAVKILEKLFIKPGKISAENS